MCHATPSCNCKSFDNIDEFYDICRQCHRLIDLSFTAPAPTPAAKKTFSPNAAMAVAIRARIEANWSEITAMRGHGVAWPTISKTFGYDFSDGTLGKHYRNMLAEKDPEAPKRKRGVFKNPDKVKKNHKQQFGIAFGARV